MVYAAPYRGPPIQVAATLLHRVLPGLRVSECISYTLDFKDGAALGCALPGHRFLCFILATQHTFCARWAKMFAGWVRR